MGRLGTSALGAQDIVPVGEEAAAHQRAVTAVAHEAVAVPVALLKRDELGASQASDSLGALDALLGKQISEAVGAVRLVLAGRELLARQRLVAVGAGEAVLVPGGTLVRDAALVDHPLALQAALCKVLLVAGHTDHLLVSRDEALVADGLLAHRATEALLMPLLALVLKLLHTGLEDVGASIAASSKVVVMAIGAVQLVVSGGEGLVHQRVGAVHTLEALLMPMLVLVRQVLGVGADGRLAVLAAVGKQVLVALDAVRVLLTQDVAVTCQVQVTVPAAKVSAMPVLVHGFGVFARKD